MAEKSEQASSFQCKICERALATLQSLKQHVKTVHDKVKDHSCEVCGQKTFNQMMLESKEETLNVVRGVAV